MRVSNIRLAVLAAVSGLALSGCAYGFDDGYGGYGGLNVGYGYNSGYGYGYDPYGYGYGSPYGYGYGDYGYSPFGWYNGFYYPGSGIYVYDRYRTRRVWSDDQRRYWEQRRQQWRDHHSGTTTGTNVGTNTATGENWSGWDRSRWRDRHGSNTTVTTTTGDGSRIRGSGRWNRGGWQGGSSVTTTTTTTSDERGNRPKSDRSSWRHSRDKTDRE